MYIVRTHTIALGIAVLCACASASSFAQSTTSIATRAAPAGKTKGAKKATSHHTVSPSRRRTPSAHVPAIIGKQAVSPAMKGMKGTGAGATDMTGGGMSGATGTGSAGTSGTASPGVLRRPPVVSSPARSPE